MRSQCFLITIVESRWEKARTDKTGFKAAMSVGVQIQYHALCASLEKNFTPPWGNYQFMCDACKWHTTIGASMVAQQTSGNPSVAAYSGTLSHART